MFVSGGGGGGHFVGLDPSAAGSLIAALGTADGRTAAAAGRLSSLLAEAGADGAGAATPRVLGQIGSWLDAARTDVRWRMAMLAAGAGVSRRNGMLLGFLPFADAGAARAAGQRHAVALQAALDRAIAADGAAADKAMQEYFDLVGMTRLAADDPAWAGGLVETLGDDGLFNVVWFAQGETKGDVSQTRTLIAPVAAALATALRHGTAPQELSKKLLDWPSYGLGVLLTAARPDTDFLVAAARSRLVDAAWSTDRRDDLLTEEAVFFLDALGNDAQASYRVLTGIGPAGERNAVHVLDPMMLLSNGDAAAAAARVLSEGLVSYPQSRGPLEWNEAVETTEVVIRYVGTIGWAVDDAHPDLSVAFLRLLHPHLDAVAAIGSASSEVDPGHLDLTRPLPDGRRPLDVAPEDLRRYLGSALQRNEAVTHMQALVASYAQSDEARANRVPLIEPDGRVRDLDPFLADSARIAGLVGVMGQGLDTAGHDEEGRTRILTGAVGFTSNKGIGKVIGWTGPLGWAAKETAGRGAGWATDRFSEWVATFEPVEGEHGVDAFLDAFDATTEASLRQQLADDPRLARLPLGEQDQIVARAVRLSSDMVRANLLEVYAEMTGETAKESK